jgi:hypothetical protein
MLRIDVALCSLRSSQDKKYQATQGLSNCFVTECPTVVVFFAVDSPFLGNVSFQRVFLMEAPSW